MDPFVKMFHKRLEYNFFQRFGKVELTHLKKHAGSANDLVKMMPNIVKTSPPSLTDMRMLVEDYL